MKSGRNSRTAAFFDVDETVINLTSMSSFHWYYYRNRRKGRGFNALRKSVDMASAFVKFAAYICHALKNDDRHSVYRKYYSSLRGVDESEYCRLADRWFTELDGDSIFNLKVMERLQMHQALGHIVVLVSGSHAPLIRPIGRRIGIDRVIATEVETSGGVYTGRILNRAPLVGRGKAAAVEAFAAEHSVDLSRSHAYSDHISDVHMLECVGNPSAVIGDKRLMAYAREKGWEIILL
ncbi:MAG: HAD-IB family hydrolase [Nitrospirae bacterium]|nr:HAD-IB family hydrolase [Nitrospirota bacterium]